MVILSCNFDINFGQTLTPGSSLSNILRTKLHAWNESSIIVQSMVKFIWQHNLSIGFYGTFKMSPGRLDFWCLKGKKRHHPPPPPTPKLQNWKSEKWAKLAFEIPHWTQLLCQVSAKSVDNNVWLLEHFLRQWHLKEKQMLKRIIKKPKWLELCKFSKRERQTLQKSNRNPCHNSHNLWQSTCCNFGRCLILACTRVQQDTV